MSMAITCIVILSDVLLKESVKCYANAPYMSEVGSYKCLESIQALPVIL